MLSLRTRQDRFISGYIRARYPDIYNEVNGYYNELDSKYPEKRDLCKTVEYLYATTGFKSHGEWYHSKRKNQMAKQESKKPNEKTTILDNMELKIPLMSNTHQITKNSPRTEVEETPLVIPDSIYDDLVKELRNDPDLYDIFNDMNIDDLSQEQQLQITVLDQSYDEHQLTTPENIPNNQCQEQQVTSSNNNIPDHVCEEIVQEFSKDPYLYDIINNMDLDEYDEQTPLEKELTTLGY